MEVEDGVEGGVATGGRAGGGKGGSVRGEEDGVVGELDRVRLSLRADGGRSEVLRFGSVA